MHKQIQMQTQTQTQVQKSINTPITAYWTSSSAHFILNIVICMLYTHGIWYACARNCGGLKSNPIATDTLFEKCVRIFCEFCLTAWMLFKVRLLANREFKSCHMLFVHCVEFINKSCYSYIVNEIAIFGFSR